MKLHLKRLLIVFLIVFPVIRIFALPLGEASRNVLLINSYHQGYMWTDSISEGILATARQYPTINLYIVYLDAKKFGQTKFEQEKMHMLQKYEGIRFDGILTTDNDALDFVVKYKQELFNNIPVVFCGISNPESYALNELDLYGFKEATSTEPIIRLVKSLIPDAKRIFIHRNEFKASQTQFDEIELIYPEYVVVDSILSMCSKTTETDVLYYIGINQDEAGNIVDNYLLFGKIDQKTTSPIFTSDNAFWGKGAVGGLFQRGTTTGKEALKLLIEIIETPDRQNFSRINQITQEYFFDKAELDKFGIQVKKLPPNSNIINQKKLLTKSNFLVLLGLLVLLSMIVIVLSVVNRMRKMEQRRSQQHLEKIEKQKNELQKAYQKLREVFSELEVTNKKLVEARKKAEESDKLKSAFLANVSHEIRTPLNSIVGFSSLLSDSGLDEAERKMYIGLIESNTDSLLVLIDEILDLSRIEAEQLVLKKANFSIDHLLDELFQTFSHGNINSKARLVIGKKIDGKTLFIHSDRIRVKQIFINLLSNAFKFTDSGSIEFGYFISRYREVVFYVKDTGIGINKEFHQEIFTRFRKLNDYSPRVYRGTGLGLAISKKLVELLGGKIWIESEPGKGSTFFFTLQGYALKDISD
jgi:signal transduction histidine kinase